MAFSDCYSAVESFLIAELQMMRLRQFLHTLTKSGSAKDHRGVDLISDMLPYGVLWYAEPNAVCNAISCAKFAAVHMML